MIVALPALLIIVSGVVSHQVLKEKVRQSISEKRRQARAELETPRQTKIIYGARF
jgi:hypothetical protein